MNTVAAQHNADMCRHCPSRASRAVTSATDDELDAAILAAIRESPGESAAWSVLREKLPAASLSRKASALVRLHTAGQVHAVKIGGRTYVSLPIHVRGAA